MALAIAQTLAFQTAPYLGTNPLVSASVSLPANSLVIVTTGSVSYLDTYHTANTPTNTGTALTWALVNTNENDDGSGYVQSQIWYAKNTAAQTITISVYYNPTAGYDVQRALCGYVITGHDLTTPIGNTNIGGLSLNVSSSNALALLSITDTSTTALTSSNMVETTVSTSSGTALLAYEPVASPGNFTASVSRALALPASVTGEIKVAASGTAHTAAGTATGTATGTAAMSNAGVGAGSSTETATGTAAASNQRALAASATGTASGTAAMSRTQAMSASGTGTATGTAAGSITAVVTISGSATITGTGTSTASVAMAQTATATGTVVATSSVDFIVIPPITLQSNGTVIADSSGAMAKTMPYESTGTATATSQAGATHTYYIFKPPTREISPVSLDPYYQLVGYHQGRTLVKRDGVWKLVQNRQEDWLDQCEYVFKGGCENRVNGTQKTELESAGYTVETRTS